MECVHTLRFIDTTYVTNAVLRVKFTAVRGTSAGCPQVGIRFIS